MRANKLNSLFSKLISAGLVIHSRPVNERRVGRSEWLVEVGDTTATSGFRAEYENSLWHYVEMVDEGKYSLMVVDGSLVCVSYQTNGDEITWHRFVYIPAVVALDVAAGEGVTDLPTADEYLETPRKSALRFEYDPAAFKHRHPYSHLHLNGSMCRIPVSGAVSIRGFVHALVDHFYPEYLGGLSREIAPTKVAHEQIAVDDLKRMLVKFPL